MSYYVVYGIDGKEEPEEGDEIATTTGWAAFADWTSALPDEQFSQVYRLGEAGFCEGAPDLDALEAELRQIVRERPHGLAPEVLPVAVRLLAAVESRPEGADALIVTDGTSGGEEGGADDEEEDEDNEDTTGDQS